MQKGKRIWQDCPICLGTGVLHDRDNYAYPESSSTPTVPPSGSEEVPCYNCEGLGIVAWGWLCETKEETMPGEKPEKPE